MEVLMCHWTVEEERTYIPLNNGDWHMKTHIKLYTSADKRCSHRYGHWTPFAALTADLHHPISTAHGVSNCLKQIINDPRHYWLFRSQHRNQYEKTLSSIQQTTCTHGTQDLWVILPKKYEAILCNNRKCQTTQSLYGRRYTIWSKVAITEFQAKTSYVGYYKIRYHYSYVINGFGQNAQPL